MIYVNKIKHHSHSIYRRSAVIEDIFITFIIFLQNNCQVVDNKVIFFLKKVF